MDLHRRNCHWEPAVTVTAEDGNGRKVLVGVGVSVIVAVGGGGVAVGMAAWVSATIVKAAAATVLCRSTALTGGCSLWYTCTTRTDDQRYHQYLGEN